MPQRPRPNFLVLVADQMSAGSMGCTGNPDLRTPNLDRLAAEGCLLQRAYCNNPVCMPARATLFTGLTPRQHGVVTNGVRLPEEVPTATAALLEAGYRTFAAGKLHLQTGLDGHGPLPRFSWEDAARWDSGEIGGLPSPYYGLERTAFLSGHVSGCFGDYVSQMKREHPEVLDAYRADGRRRVPGASITWRTAVPAELHYNHWIADRTIEIIEETSERPFFAWCSFPDPHGPWAAAKPFCDMYDPDSLKLDPTWRETGDPLPFLADYRTHLPSFLRAEDEAGLRETMAQYYGMISHVDQNIGRVMQALRESGQDQNTIVVFLSDHGEYLGSHGLMGKTPWPYEPLLRVPMIWRVPGAPARCSHDLTGHLDFAPTVMDYAGLDPAALLPPGHNRAERSLPGRSLRPLLEGGEREPRPALVEFENNAKPGTPVHMRTLVTARYKLTLYPPHAEGLLYDLQEDPDELHNLWADPHHRDIRARLTEQLLRELVLTDRHNLPREAGA